MATVTLPNPGHAVIAFSKAMRHAESRHNDMRNCKTCDQEAAEQWRRDAELFSNLIKQPQEG